MFTGLIQHMGTISRRSEAGNVIRITVDKDGWQHDPARGDSIAVNGCCLTVVEKTGDQLDFDMVRTTSDTTTLASLDVGARVNLEHAATPSTLLGGHLVQGHVESTGTVVHNREFEDRGWILKIKTSETLSRFLIKKGSITVDGVSLTIAETIDQTLEIALIPETLERTSLSLLQEGDLVNLEADCLAKMVSALLERTPPR
ncbi:MAG TPA: riboflavin synthase, partial [Phycisphaerales bacterium]|nr:riboflavin synthase [Phycisphaerales bacterium]